MELDEVSNLLINNSIKLIRFLYCDNSSIIRGKAATDKTFDASKKAGIGLTVAQQAVNMFDQLQPVEGFQPVREVRLVPDLQSLKILPYAENTAAVMCDLMTSENKSWAACQRYFIKRMISSFEHHGYKIQAAFENEFCLYKQNDNGDCIPLDHSQCFSSISMASASKIINEIINALEKQNIQVEFYYPECSFGQHEISIHYSDPLTAADNQIWFRETVRSVAENHGLKASFSPKPDKDSAGNGSHIHLSIWDLENNRNLLFDKDEKYQLSKIGRNFTAGILAHTPALLALTAPSVNSYRRLKPFSWSSAYTCWGPENREATVRLIQPSSLDNKDNINLEYKPSDPSNNPYLALGSLIAAGLDGIINDLHPGSPTLYDPATFTDEERMKLNIYRYPETLNTALKELNKDTVLQNALGCELLKVFTAVRQSEYDIFSKKDVSFEIENHMFKY
ncbi:MAG TPA: glutamine synthetase family protein [Victivallales bacterium]|nr:glutamine synthetase family protein [Victivallales bacterium]